MSTGHTYKFFGFSISHTTPNLPVYFVPTIYASYSLYLYLPLPQLPTDNPPCDLYFCESVPVLDLCLVFVFLGLVVDSCKFVVILLFVFFIFFFFLDKSL